MIGIQLDMCIKGHPNDRPHAAIHSAQLGGLNEQVVGQLQKGVHTFVVTLSKLITWPTRLDHEQNLSVLATHLVHLHNANHASKCTVITLISIIVNLLCGPLVSSGKFG